VSKSTVVEAYDRLAAEGAIQSRPGSGFYVAGPSLPAAPFRPAAKREREVDPFWIMHQALAPSAGALRPGCGWLPPDWLPEQAIRRHLRALARDPECDLLSYGPPLGYEPLRVQLSRRLADRGVLAGPDAILLTDSATAAIDMICRFLLRPGDAVLIDDPCYYNFQSMLATHHVRVHAVPYTDTGPDLEAFAQAAQAHAPRLYITNATLHNPTGGSLAPATAHRLLKLADRHDIAIVEDDIFADFLEDAPPRLAALDGLSRVAYVGSFSKTLSASVRCGFIAARPDWIEPLVDLKLATSFGNCDLSARLAHALLVDGSYRRHVEAIRGRLAGAMEQVLGQLAATGLTPWLRPKGGLFLWAALPDGVDSAAVARAALAEDVVLAPGNVFSLGQTAGRFLRFNVAQSADPRNFAVLGDVLRRRLS
ncbi:MAG: PLP-dependent aminotransferase family protein, partial [Alphaproteobacteria bacterium]